MTNQPPAGDSLQSLWQPDAPPTLVLYNIYLAARALQQAASGGSSNGILIPSSDYVAYTYYGATNNIETAVYKTGGSGGSTVATLTFTYVGGGAANNDNVATLTKS